MLGFLDGHWLTKLRRPIKLLSSFGCMGTVKVFDKSETLGRLSVVVIRAVDVTQLTEPREEILRGNDVKKNLYAE
jgi:hypothetical protein